MHRVPSSSSPSSQQLQSDHGRLDRMFDALISRALLGDWRDCDEIWGGFCKQLEEHMQYEESSLFPPYAASGVVEARVIENLRLEHEQIRKQLDRLGLDIQVHAIRATAIEEFVNQLREHAKRETATLYPFCQAPGNTGTVPPPRAGLPAGR